MKYFPIKDLGHGIETKYSGTSQDRGTLRKAEGINCVPDRALSSAPTWATAWGYTNIVSAVASALTGASNVNFVTVQDANGNTFLAAFDVSTNTFKGWWCVANGTAAPNFASASGVTITATNDAIHRGKTVGLPWYGSWIGNRLFLGNGTAADANLVWGGGTLAVLGPASLPADTRPFKYQFPGCTCFMMTPEGNVLGAGNAANPLYIWGSDPPNAQFPTPDGLLTADRSFVSLNRYAPNASLITGLSPAGRGILVHLSTGGCMFIGSWNRSRDGNLFSQAPLKNFAGAPNPACIANPGHNPNYLGADLEVYTVVTKSAPGVNVTEPRDQEIETWKSSGQWNREMTRGSGVTYKPFILDDTLNGRLWISAQVGLKSQPALYVWDRISHSSTGPHRYPSLVCASPLLNQNLPGAAAQPLATGSSFVVVGVSLDGALLYADLGLTGELAIDPPGTALGAAYQIAATQPTPSPGLACVGVYGTLMNQFALVDAAGHVSTLADPWSDWVDAGSSVPGGITTWLNNASLAIVEFSPEDFGSPIYEKDYCEVRLNWLEMQRVYAGVAVKSNNMIDWQWLGLAFPTEVQNAVFTVKGTRAKVRLFLVCFNGKPCNLPDIGVSFLQGVAP